VSSFGQPENLDETDEAVFASFRIATGFVMSMNFDMNLTFIDGIEALSIIGDIY
jgi:hypothetical protein